LRVHGFFVDFPIAQMLKLVYDQYKDAGEDGLVALGIS
jgi:hypothetical protein